MDPMSLIGAGTSLVGGIMGAQAQDQANDENWQINMLNYSLADREREDRIKAEYQAEQQRVQEEEQQKQGVTDAQGNRSHYVPGKGWVTDLSYQGQDQQNRANQTLDATQQERMQELSNDMPLQRAQMERTYDQKAGNADQADALQRMFHDALISGPDKSTGDQLYAAQARGINDGYDATQADASRTAVRSGTPNAGAALASLAQQRSKDLAQASIQDYIQGQQMSKDNYNQKLGNISQLLQMFQGASQQGIQGPQVDSPMGYSPQSASQMGAFQSADANLQENDGAQQLAGAEGAQGGRVDYVQPDYGMANTLASFGGQLSKIGNGGGRSSSSSGGTTSSLGGSGGLGSLTSLFGGGNSGLF